MAKKPQSKSTKKGPSSKDKKLIIILVSVGVFVFIVLPIIFFAILMMLATKTVKDTTGVDVNKGTIEIKDKEGNSFSATSDESKELPSDFPKSEITLYDGQRIATSRIVHDGKTSWTVTVETTDSLDKTSAAIKNDLKKDGWAIETEYETTNSSHVSAKKEGYSVVVTSLSQDGKTNITYVISQQ
ncbi:hypothetical protein KC939_01925 [Candidatus Saccharibacteria bacterium]|nr:hypothetical protein [Candidatus Saccharibacteria bacterium]